LRITLGTNALISDTLTLRNCLPPTISFDEISATRF
jgi:hypothetical protein